MIVTIQPKIGNHGNDRFRQLEQRPLRPMDDVQNHGHRGHFLESTMVQNLMLQQNS